MARPQLEKIEKGIFFDPKRGQYIARVRFGKDYEKCFSRKIDARNWRTALVADMRIAPPEVSYSTSKGWGFSLEVGGQFVERHFGDLSTAVKTFHDVRHQLESGSFVSEETRSITVEQLASSWFETKVDIEFSTLMRYKSDYHNSIHPTLGNVAVYSLTEEKLQAYVRELLVAGKSPATIDKSVALLSQILKFARSQKIIRTDPTENLNLPKVTRKRGRALSPETVNRLAKLCGPYEPMIRMFVSLGLRAEEMAALKVKHVDLEKKTLTVATTFKLGQGYTRTVGSTKGNQERPLPLNAEQQKFFAAHLKGKGPEDFVWTGVRGGPLNLNWFRRRYLQPALEQLGETDISLHTLRHTFGSTLFSRRVSPAVASKLMGHTKVETTLKSYAHVINGDDVEAMNEFLVFFESETGQERGEMVNAQTSQPTLGSLKPLMPSRRKARARVASRRIELPTHGLGNRCSIH